MPKRSDIKKVLILGSGPIVIGQACEFDYSGTQACKALMKEGYEVILVNSNPATIMTDPEIATRIYIEPLKVDFIEKIIAKEKPQAIIPTLGGQTALNLALSLHEQGILKKYSVELLGATPTVIKAAEDREIFRDILDQVDAKYPKSELVRDFTSAMKASDELGFPLILRPNYTLGGGGGGIAYSLEEYQKMIAQALHESPTSEVLVEESILGWKEFELEIMRDSAGTFVVVCTIENFDPCGVHTGDSITVAPQQTLSDIEYQAMRDEAMKIVNKVGVETGGANIQFAVHPKTGERVVIEMNPRVSRSSALASKATGFPIAKIAALLSVGYNLPEVTNDITQVTPSCYEPALDYVVCKIPRFAFEKFNGSKDLLSTQMKSVGEVMSLGRTFQESLMKALLSLESSPEGVPDVIFSLEKVSYPNSQRIFHIFQAFREGKSIEELYSLTEITPWFLEQVESIVAFEKIISSMAADLKNFIMEKDFRIDKKYENLKVQILKAKRLGFSDARMAKLMQTSTNEIYKARELFDFHPAFLQVDTCAGEFASETPYFYSSYWSDPKSTYALKAKFNLNKAPVVVIGSGPNRIGQGIEFDYSCVRGVKAFQKSGFPVVMVNSNPETVSTDYDTSDVLFFEPLTLESLHEIFRFVKPYGFVSQLGGQTPINLTSQLLKKEHKLLGSSLSSIDLAEDRMQFSQICQKLGLKIPRSALAANFSEAESLAQDLGFPIICRPSYVLGGRRMEVVENQDELRNYFLRHQVAIHVDRPCLMDQFLEGALEVDVDLVRGQDWVLVGGIVEHIEAAGVHSGDSMGVIPPQRLREETQLKIEQVAIQLAHEMNVLGHLNLQLAIKNDVVYLLEANPRSSRSVPFIAKATSIPLIDLGVQAVLGHKAEDLKLKNLDWKNMSTICVKGVVFPFKKFSESDSILGPEMKSTGESMGRGATYSEALMKAFMAANIKIPTSGEVFLSLRDKDKKQMLPLVLDLVAMGFQLSATSGTADFLNKKGFEVQTLKKVHEGRPNCVDHIRSGQVSFVINTTTGRHAIEASFDIRRACIDLNLPCLTESDAAEAFILAIKNAKKALFQVDYLPQSLTF